VADAEGTFDVLDDLHDADDELRLKALLTLGRLLMMRGMMDEALHYFSLASPLAEGSAPASRGVLEGNIATIQFQMRHYAEAREWFHRAVASFTEGGVDKSAAFALRGVGMCYSKEKDYTEALAWYEQALARVGDPAEATKEYIGIIESMGVDYVNLAERQGAAAFAKAIECFAQCRDLAEKAGLQVARAVALRNLAMTYAEKDYEGRDLQRAQVLYDEALNIVRAAGVQLLESQILRDLAGVLEEGGRHEEALKTFRQFYDLERQLLNKETESQIRTLEVKLATERQESEARAERERAERLSTELERERQHVTTTSLSIGQKNAALRETRLELKKLTDKATSAVATALRRLITMIEMAEESDDYWEDLERQLHTVHGSALDALAGRFPQLTATERRVCAMIMHDLSTKDIARLLSVEPRSVEKYRQRIRKKLAIDEQTNLATFLAGLGAEAP
jgi:tetratricopeptide (TPR) repeat protein